MSSPTPSLVPISDTTCIEDVKRICDGSGRVALGEPNAPAGFGAAGAVKVTGGNCTAAAGAGASAESAARV